MADRDFIIQYINRKLQMNFLTFPYFSRFFEPHTVNAMYFPLFLILWAVHRGKIFLNV